MATQWNTYPVEFRGGLVSNLSPLQQGINAIGSATILQNFEPSLQGGYKKVLGYQKFSDTEVPGTGELEGVSVMPYQTANIVMAVRNKSYYLSTGGAWTLKGTAASTVTSKVRHTWYNFDGGNDVVFVDGINFPAYYDVAAGSLSFLTSSTTNDVVEGASHVANHKNTLFFSVGSELVFTAPYTSDDFNPANGAGSINVGSDITGLIGFRDQLVIFSKERIQTLSGSTAADFQLQPVTLDLGCLYEDTIQEVGGDIAFLSSDGIRTLSATDRFGDFGLDVASKPVKKQADDLLSTATSFASSVIREKGQYRLYGFATTQDDASAKGLLGTKFIDQGGSGFNWGTLKGFKVKVIDSKFVGNQELLVFANDDGYVYTMESGSSRDSETIDAVFQSPFLPLQDPRVRKTFYKLILYLEPTGNFGFDTSIKLDQLEPNIIQPNTITIDAQGTQAFLYGESTSVYGTATYGQAFEKEYPNSIVGSGKTVAIRIEDNSTSASFTLDTAVIEYGINERR
jgi:hypothetical protein